jgi:hypothetical protein
MDAVPALTAVGRGLLVVSHLTLHVFDRIVKVETVAC